MFLEVYSYLIISMIVIKVTAIIGRIELVVGRFIRQRLSSFHKFILSSWCIIMYHIIKYHVSSPLGALSKSQVWEVPPFVWGWTLLCTTCNFAFLIRIQQTKELCVQCKNVGYYNYKLRMARCTTEFPTIWTIQIAGGRCCENEN